MIYPQKLLYLEIFMDVKEIEYYINKYYFE